MAWPSSANSPAVMSFRMTVPERADPYLVLPEALIALHDSHHFVVCHAFTKFLPDSFTTPEKRGATFLSRSSFGAI